jgi:exopolysaccharide biosynthesis WecB/TagA/CpsF family protein
VDAVDYDATVARVVCAAHQSQPLAISALAVHGLMTGALDRTHRYRLNRLDLVVPDGQPVRWALNRLYGVALPDRVYGPQLMLQICAEAAAQNLPIFLFGGSPALLTRLASQLEKKFAGLSIAGTRPSCFRTLTLRERDALIDEIRCSGAKITFVGLGCPRQEVFVYELRDAVRMPLLAVGAAFNFHAGQLAQAPAWMQRAGLEWLFRLASEPARLWRRYLLLNPLYLLLVGLQAVGLYRLDPAAARPPDREVCYG